MSIFNLFFSSFKCFSIPLSIGINSFKIRNFYLLSYDPSLSLFPICSSSIERAQKAILEKFRSKFKEEHGPLQIIINTMNRRQVITYDKDGKALRKDFLTWNADYHGKDWSGNDLWIREHIHGVHSEPKFITTMKQDPKTGDHIPNKEHQGETVVYDIELTDKNRKQVIEDIINKCNG